MVEINKLDLIESGHIYQNFIAQRIREDFGIELTWSEKVGLKIYTESFWNARSNGLTDSPQQDAEYYFMLDYFGLDWIDLGKTDVLTGPDRMRDWKEYGMDFIGREEFKEYCRRNIQFWRDQRELI
jgi:hypothetical protein